MYVFTHMTPESPALDCIVSVLMRTHIVSVVIVLGVGVFGVVGCGDNLELAPIGPDTVIDKPPALLSSTTHVEVAFHADGAASFTCQLDDAAAMACASPWTFDVTDGAHEVAIAAIGVDHGVGEPATARFRVDTVAPTVAITGGPSGAPDTATPAFAFTASSDATVVECAVDDAAFVPCTSPTTTSALGLGSHTFTVRAADAAANAATATLSFVLGACGDNSGQGTELCDGTDLRGQSCESLGHAPGTLACSATCGAFDASGCDGGFVAENTGFTGKVCFDGVKFGSTPFVAACTEDTGIWRLVFQTGIAEVWTNLDGSVAGQQVVNLHGRAVIPGLDNPSAVFLVDNSNGANSYRSNLFSSTTQAMAWPAGSQVTFATAGMPIEMFSAKTGSSVNNAMGGWHPTLGAVVLHGNAGNAATVSTVGPNVTGTVTSITSGAFSLPSTDINIAVFGKTPAGDPATGGGIYWTCDQLGAAGGTYIEHDSGIPDDEKSLVATLLPDPASFSSATRMCPTTAGIVGGFASTYYAALRGGGQVYKTTDGGEHWVKSNTGLPAGAEVYSLALDCERLVSGFPNLCNNHDLLYAATSRGLYQSTDAGASWTVAGLEGKVVRGVTLPNDHPVGTAPRIVVGVDDEVMIYQKAP